jgi:ribosomal protein L31
LVGSTISNLYKKVGVEGNMYGNRFSSLEPEYVNTGGFEYFSNQDPSVGRHDDTERELGDTIINMMTRIGCIAILAGFTFVAILNAAGLSDAFWQLVYGFFGGGGEGGGGSNPGCFSPSTLVWTPIGMVPISKIKENDEIFTMNVETGSIETRTVARTFSTTRSDLVKVETKDNSIICSDNHPFYAVDGKWKEIKDITGKVRTANGSLQVKVTRLGKKKMKVFDLQIGETRNYFVTKSKFLVHNKGGGK